MNEMTIIFTVLNEGEELRKTLKCLKEFTQVPFPIILINDCSTDNFNYMELAIEFGALYIEHDRRKGPAVSRDEGIAICTTEYFLLLDAHMRIYQSDWYEQIVNELRKNEKILLCCSTVALDENAVIVNNNFKGYGAYITLVNTDVHWITNLNGQDSMVPCVLGASYACRKKFWQSLKGLKGLKQYGLEEQLISIKVWLSGGICKVLKDVCFGHIFRDGQLAVYEVPVMEYYLNQLLIVELFYDVYYKKRYIVNLRKTVGTELVNIWMEGFKQYRQSIMEEKEYYKEKFCHDFDFILKLNNSANFL